VVTGQWLKPGIHINAVGSTLPNLRELDDATIRMCDLIVVDSKDQVTKESGDIILPLASGVLKAEKIHDLWELVKGAVARRHDEEITIFKSVGTALQDLIAARTVYRLARKKGIGVELGDLLVSRSAATK
jgi:ornithine cyclodeaminase/alanine dehydrogenase-like protein (mu-crystallin family)